MTRKQAGTSFVVVATALAGGLLATPALAATPAPATNLALTSSNAKVTATWRYSPDTPYADVCWATGAAPAAPTDPGATCTGNLGGSGTYTFSAEAGTLYGVSVFAVDNGEYSSPTSGTITARDQAPAPPKGLFTQAAECLDHVDRLNVYWQDDWQANSDTRDFVVTWAPGSAVPPADPAAGFVVQPHGSPIGATFVDLVPDRIYTFAVRTRDTALQLSSPTVVRAATRFPGIAAATADSASAAPATRHFCPGDADEGPYWATATATRGGHLRMAYRGEAEVDYAGHAADGVWTDRFLGASSLARPRIDATPAGDVFVSWGSHEGLLYRQRVDGRWSARRTISSVGDRTVLGVAYDGTHAHVLVRWTHGLRYFSRVGGNWVGSAVPGASRYDAAALTRDPVSDRIVLVDRRRTSTARTLRVAVLSPRATNVTGFRTWWSTSGTAVDFRPTSVASIGGVITVGEQRASRPAAAADGPYVQQGSASSHRRPLRVTGTSAADRDVVVSALQRNRVVVTWRRTEANWASDTVGIWTEEVVHHAGGSTTFPRLRRWTASAYDVPVAAFRDEHGGYSVVYTTRYTDLPQ